MLASPGIQSRCFLEPACLPACLLGSHTPSPPYPQPSADSHIYTHCRPALGSRADVSLCLPAPSPRTHMCIHSHTHTPTHTTVAWVVPNDSWISCHNGGCLPPLPPSPFPRSSPSKHCLNLHVSSYSLLHSSTGQARSH